MLNFTPTTLAPLPTSTQGTCAGMPCHSLLDSYKLAISCSNWSICLCLCGGCDVFGQLLNFESDRGILTVHNSHHLMQPDINTCLNAAECLQVRILCCIITVTNPAHATAVLPCRAMYLLPAHEKNHGLLTPMQFGFVLFIWHTLYHLLLKCQRSKCCNNPDSGSTSQQLRCHLLDLHMKKMQELHHHHTNTAVSQHYLLSLSDSLAITLHTTVSACW